MAGTHEQAGLLEPANGTPKVRAIDGEDLKSLPIHISDPAGDVRRIPIRRIDNGISIRGETSLTGRELFEVPKRNPRLVASLALLGNGREEIAHDWHGQNGSNDAVEEDSELH